MKYVLTNIRNLAGREKFIFAIMLICVFVSAWIMTFSYGLYQNFHALVVDSDEEGRTAIPNIIKSDERLTFGGFKTYLEALPTELLNSAENIMCESYIDSEDPKHPDNINSTYLDSRFTFRNGNYQTSSFIEELWKSEGILMSGNFFSDDDEMLGNNCVIVNNSIMTDSFAREQYANLIIDDNTALMFGKEYKIIGTTGAFGIMVPFLSVPADVPVYYIHFQFEKTLTKEIYKTLIDTANEVIPGKLNFPKLELPDSDSLYIYHNIMLISVLIAALTIVNFAFLYNFIFGRRKRQLAIMRICGCTAARAVWICLGECIVLCVPVFLAGMLTYIPFMKHVLSPLFEYMADSYSLWIYAAIFGIYFIMLLAIMSVLLSGQIRKTLAEGRKG